MHIVQIGGIYTCTSARKGLVRWTNPHRVLVNLWHRYFPSRQKYMQYCCHTKLHGLSYIEISIMNYRLLKFCLTHEQEWKLTNRGSIILNIIFCRNQSLFRAKVILIESIILKVHNLYYIDTKVISRTLRL